MMVVVTEGHFFNMFLIIDRGGYTPRGLYARWAIYRRGDIYPAGYIPPRGYISPRGYMLLHTLLCAPPGLRTKSEIARCLANRYDLIVNMWVYPVRVRRPPPKIANANL